MAQINDQRTFPRILAVCRIFDFEGKFLGFTLDLSTIGIQIIVYKNFPDKSSFEIILNHQKENEIMGLDIKVKIEQMWRISTNEEFDQIGGKIIEVDNPKYFENLLSYCYQKAKEKYQFE
jgi:choline kinase